MRSVVKVPFVKPKIGRFVPKIRLKRLTVLYSKCVYLSILWDSFWVGV